MNGISINCFVYYKVNFKQGNLNLQNTIQITRIYDVDHMNRKSSINIVQVLSYFSLQSAYI